MTNRRETLTPDQKIPRRAVLKGVSGGMAAGLSTYLGGVPHQPQTNISRNTNANPTSTRQAFVTLPGLSSVSILLNLPRLAERSDGPPLLIMDSYDYRRLRTKPQTEQREKKNLYLSLAFDDLRRQGILRLVDYSELYSKNRQKSNIRQSQDLLAAMPEEVSQQTAERGTRGWTDYARGPYQETFRRSLGEDGIGKQRKDAKGQVQKMERGTGDYIGWTEKFVHKCVAALEVRQRLDQISNLDVQYVIAGGEYKMLGELLNTTRTPGNEPDTHLLNVETKSIDADASRLRELEPNERIMGFNPERVSQTRDILESIGEVVTDMTGVQYDDWHILGSSFALPEYQDLFDYHTIRSEIQVSLDSTQLADETSRILTTLEHEAEESHSQRTLEYEVERLAETHNVIPHSEPSIGRGVDMVECALTLPQHSRELRSFSDRGDVSQAAIFLATSIINNPIRNYNKNTIHRRATDLMARIDPSLVDRQKLAGFRKEEHLDTYMENNDWYELTNRER